MKVNSPQLGNTVPNVAVGGCRLNPLTVHAVSNCVFDDNAVLIPSWKMRRQFQEAGYSDIAVRYRVFFLDLLHFYVSSNFACGGYR